MPTSLRLPPELEADIKQLAKEHGRSEHGEMLWALRQYVEQQKKENEAMATYRVTEKNRTTGERTVWIEAKSRTEAIAKYRAENTVPGNSTVTASILK